MSESISDESLIKYQHSSGSEEPVATRTTRKRKIVPTTNTKAGVKRVKTEKKNVNTKTTTYSPHWTDSDWLSETCDLHSNVAENLLELFDAANSIPFIARYRRDLTNNMSPDELRNVKEHYDQMQVVKSKISTVAKMVNNLGKLTPKLESAILNAKNLDEIEHLYAPFKLGSKKLRSERAKELGLEDDAINILQGKQDVVIEILAQDKSLNVEDTKSGIVDIISYAIAHDMETLKLIRNMKMKARDIYLETKRMRSTKTENELAEEEIEKYSNYFQFRANILFIKSHQVLAIYRAKKLKIISVKIVLSNRLSDEFKCFCTKNWLVQGKKSSLRERLFDTACADAYSRFVAPLIERQIVNELISKAKKEAIGVFESNLRNMLMANPCKERILGLDPGFKHGCKYALISETGNVLAKGVFYPDQKKITTKNESVSNLASLINSFHCNIIALGNGTGCRETESWITSLKTAGILKEAVKYAIVNESGASIYSCSEEAKKEFKDLDPNIISAISIARRLQDPLAELIKIEPKHLGVGMYQHDIKEKELTESLEEIIMECVSFVGVNLNTASVNLLQRIAGLNSKRAANLIQYRTDIGSFSDRNQLKSVKGIGEKVFEQCAGFLKIVPISKSADILLFDTQTINKLDQTWIHPESYQIAEKFIKACGLSKDNIGTRRFIETVENYVKDKKIEKICCELKASVNQVQIIIDALSKPIDYDIRLDSLQSSLFKTGLTKLSNISAGMILTGRIQNVTNFGSFVDIGVGVNGLIHISKYKGFNPQLGNHVEVQVLEIDMKRRRISLALQSIITT